MAKIGFRSPLHEAFDNNENRSVEIILNFMSKIARNNSKNFQDILMDMTDYRGF